MKQKYCAWNLKILLIFFFLERSTKSINKRFKKQFKLCVHIKGLHAVQLVSIDRSKVCKSKSGEKGHKLNTVWFHDGLRYQELKHRVASFLLRHIRVHGHLHYSWWHPFHRLLSHTVLFALKTLSAPAIIAIVTRELNPKLSGSFHTLTITVHWSWHAQDCHQTLGQRWLDKEDSFINTTALREKPQSWPLMIKTFTWHSHGFLIAFKKWHKKGWRYSLCLLHSAADFFLRLFNCCQSCTDSLCINALLQKHPQQSLKVKAALRNTNSPS